MAKNERRGGQYRKLLLEQRGQAPEAEEPSGGAFFRIRFYVSLCLFVAYVILDYTKASVGTVDSSRIYAEIERDMTDGTNLQEAWSNAINSVWVSGSEQDESTQTKEDSREGDEESGESIGPAQETGEEEKESSEEELPVT